MMRINVANGLLCAGFLMSCPAFFGAYAQAQAIPLLPFPLSPGICITCTESCATDTVYIGPGEYNDGVCVTDGFECGYRPVTLAGFHTPIQFTCYCKTSNLPFFGRYVEILPRVRVWVWVYYCACF
jgi:hypothetical protein